MEKGKWKRIFLLLMLFSVVFFSSCSCSGDQEIAVRSLTISKAKLDVKIDSEFTLSYTVAPIKTSINGVYISTSNNVIETGETETNENSGQVLFTAIKAGQSIITITTKDGEFSKTCEVEVFDTSILSAPTNISFDGDKLVWDVVNTDINELPRQAEERYNVSVKWGDTEEKFEVYSNSFSSLANFSFLTDVQYEVSVRAVGDNIKNYDSEVSQSYSFYILSVPDLNIVNGTANWREHYENNEQFIKANYFILNYNNNGDYVIVANNGNIANNIFDLRQLGASDYTVSIQAINADLLLEDMQDEIDEYMLGQSGVLVYEVEGVSYVASKISNENIIYTFIKPTNLTLVNNETANTVINGVNVASSFMPSKIQWEGESADYKNKIKYALVFSKDGISSSVNLPAGVCEFIFTPAFIQNTLINSLNVSSLSPFFDVVIHTQLANPDESNKFILPGASNITSFEFIQLTELNFNLTLENDIIKFSQPASFSNPQFIFVNESKLQSVTVFTTNGEINIASLLNGLDGQFKIFANARGEASVINNINLDFSISLQKLIIENLEIVKINDDYFISWQDNTLAQSYKISGTGDDIFVHSQLDRAEYYNEIAKRWRYPISVSAGDVIDISVTAVAKENTDNEWYFNSDASFIQVAQFPKVVFELTDKVISWSVTTTNPILSRNNGYAIEVVDSVSGSIVFNSNVSIQQNSFNTSSLLPGDYEIKVVAKGLLNAVGSRLYVLNSDVETFAFTKLETVEMGVENSKLVWNRTVEGLPDNAPYTACDEYILYKNGEVYNALLIEVDGKITVSFDSDIQTNSVFSVAVTRPAGAKNFVTSNISEEILVKSISVKNFKKVGDNFEFEPSIMVGGQDVAERYLLTGTHSGNAGYSYEETHITANGVNFMAGKYIVPVKPLLAGAGEYIFKLTTIGSMFGGVAYLGSINEESLSVVQLDSPLENQVVVDRGGLAILKYFPVSTNALEIPISVEVSFYKNSELYNQPIIYNYNNLEFGQASMIKLYIPIAFNIAAGSYEVFVKFIGDGNNYVLDSERVLANNETAVTKFEEVSVYIENGQLKWEQQPLATKYLVSLNSTSEIEVEGNSLSTAGWNAGNTDVRVVAYADSYLMSNASQNFIAKKLNSPILSPNEIEGAKVISWNSLEGASSYDLYKINIENEFIANASSLYWQINKNEEVGNVSYFIKARGTVDTRTQENKLTGYLDSNESSILELVFIEQTLETSVNKGLITWNAINGALNYQVDLYDFNLYPTFKNLMHTTTVNVTTFNANIFESIISGAYMVEVKVNKINANSNIIVSTHEENNTYNLPMLKIDNLSGTPIYDNIRVENGNFAFDITNGFLTNYCNQLININPSSETFYTDNINISTFAQMLMEQELVDESVIEIFNPLINFNVYLKYNDNNIIKLSGKTPTHGVINSDYITLYYAIHGGAGIYGIEFEQLGNTSNNAEVIGVIDGKRTTPLSAIKAGQPLSPISEGGVSIIDGKLIWAYPAGFNDEFIIEFTDETDETITKTITVGDVADGDNLWQAVKVNNIVTLDLVACVIGNELKSDINYSIKLYAKGTVDSTVITSDIYLNGEINNIEPMFRVLASTENFNVEAGVLYWETVEGAKSYSLSFYLYDGISYNLVQVNGKPNIVVDSNKNTFSVQDVADLVKGNYRVELRALGNDENIINLPSRVESLYVVKLGEVAEVYVEDGRFAFEEIFYNDINPEDGSVLSSVAVDSYYVVVVERRDGRIINSMFIGEENLKQENGIYLIELDDIFNLSNSDYRVEIYANGNDEYLLSGNVVVSNYLTRSIAPDYFTIDRDGLITWTETADYYIVYVSETRVQFNEEDETRGYTINNYFNINDYVNSIYGQYNRIYSFYVRALNDNAERDKQNEFPPIIRSKRAGNLNLFVMEMPTIRLQNGDINWQSNIYINIKSNIAESFLTITGNFLINEQVENITLTVRCSADNAIFENKKYIAENKGNGEFYIDMKNMPTVGDTLSLITGELYDISLEYIGNIGEALPNRTTYVTSDVLVVEGFVTKPTPTGLIAVSGETIENELFNNYILWSPVDGVTDYRIKTFGYNTEGKLVLVKSYETTDYDTPYIGVYEDKIYFAVDEIVDYFSTNGYGQLIRYEIVSKGENWQKGVGSKIIASTPSEHIEVNYPQSPTQFHYDGKGAITWLNSSSGEVIIEVKYKIETAEGYYNSDNFVNNHESEIISRTVEAGYSVDKIKVNNQVSGICGFYQLKYLTSDIEYIKIKTRAEGLNSLQLRLDKTEDGTLSQGYAVFQLFYGGDGSTVAPFVVKDKTSLYNINRYLNSHFVLGNDITLSGAWTPIGSAGNTVNTVYNGTPSEFTGTFDGANYAINNVNLQGEDEAATAKKYAGLFYSTSASATIKNLTVQFVSNNIVASKINLIVGGVVAKANYGIIQSVIVTGTLIADGSTETIYSNHLGAITFENYGQIINCLSSVGIKENNGRQTFTGGIAVSNFNRIAMSGVTLTEQSLSGTTVGGIVATNYSIIFECFFNGRLIVNATNFDGNCYFGGITALAEVKAESSSNISRSYAIVRSEIREVSLGFDCFGGGLVGLTKSINNYLEYGYVNFISHLATNNNGGVKVGIVYGSFISGVTQHIYYPNPTTSITKIVGSGSTPGGVINRNSVDDCVLALNSNIGLYIFKNAGKGYPSLYWEV